MSRNSASMQWRTPSRRDGARARLGAPGTCAVAAWVVLLGHAQLAYPQGTDDAGGDYLLATPQIVDPLRPLAGASVAAKFVKVRAAVVSVADPLETHLGRAFDIQVSSLIRAFHAKGFVLDGYAFTWDPKLAGDAAHGIRVPERGSQAYEQGQRTRPSVLLFRRDEWRRESRDPQTGPEGVLYVALFLVGESPTFGLQPAAFLDAARCATALNGWSGNWRARRAPALTMPQAAQTLREPCPNLFDSAVFAGTSLEAVRDLEVIGPSFSGSMESLALAVANLIEARAVCGRECTSRRLEVNVTSPSASVSSNARIDDWVRRLDRPAAGVPRTEFRYTTLAAGLEQQLYTLCHKRELPGNDLRPRQSPGDAPTIAGTRGGVASAARPPRVANPILILAEESTFGGGVAEILEHRKFEACRKRVRVAQFPQNIAAIRAEHSRLEEQSAATLNQTLQTGERLLRLDLSQLDENIDRPASYHPALSSRSDELMLYRLFDSQRVWVDPVVVAIVATDVRDRLFLLNEVRKNLPTALPVLMEMDFLTAHPDYRSIMRGAVVIPYGDTTVVLDQKRHVVDYCGYAQQPCLYLAFPADYAANIFRAAVALIEKFDAIERGMPVPERTGRGAPGTATPLMLDAFVATLGGFQQVGTKEDRGNSGEQSTRTGFRPGIFLAADSRIDVGRPFYVALFLFGLLALAVTGWQAWHREEHLGIVSPLRNPVPFHGVADVDRSSAQARWSPTLWTLCVLLGLAGFTLVAVALVQWPQVAAVAPNFEERTFSLAHGRDGLALAGLVAAYAVVAILGFWRLTLWGRRYEGHRRLAGPAGPDRGTHEHRASDGNHWMGVAAAAAVLLALAISAGITRGLPHGIDSPWPSLLASVVLLPVGAWFLGQFRTHAQRWSQFALVLGRATDTVAHEVFKSYEPKDRPTWPTPTALGEVPQSPLSLQFRARDLASFVRSDGAQWYDDTRRLLAGEWPFAGAADPRFMAWQARLVAEMRYAAVAVRTAAWCGIVAPTAVLLGMNVYPPHDVRLQTVAATGLIVVGFLLLMYHALRLERHPLLSRMFTQHGDAMSIGGAVSALWPKLIAAAVILVPVLLPDFMGWLRDVLRSINSLQ